MTIDTVRIGPINYEVKSVERLRGDDGSYLYGHIKYDDCAIEIDAAYISSQRLPMILWHEIIHGILEKSGLDGTDEKIIEVLGYGIVEVLQENPELLRMDYRRGKE